jgi:hypothetical protein
MRNALAFHLAGRFGLDAPSFAFVDVSFGASYQGIYLLTERIAQSRRCSGEPPEAPMIVRREGDGKGDARDWVSTQGHTWTYYRPSRKHVRDEVRRDIRNAIDQLEEVVERLDSSDLGSLAMVADVDSFVDFAILQELSGNVDAYWKSMYVTICGDRDRRIVMVPVWDFDLAFGNASFRDGWRTDVFVHRAMEKELGEEVVGALWQRLWANRAFRALVRARWEILRARALLSMQARWLRSWTAGAFRSEVRLDVATLAGKLWDDWLGQTLVSRGQSLVRLRS